VEDLTKHYGSVHALDGISFSAAPGEVFGLLGHNGAEKSTLDHIPEVDIVRADGREERLRLADGRVFVALLMPIVLAVVCNITAPERNERPSSNIVIVDEGDTGLRAALSRATKRSVDLDMRDIGSEKEARRLVRADDEDMAVIAGPKGSWRATVLLPEDASPATQTIAGIVPDAVAALADRREV